MCYNLSMLNTRKFWTLQIFFLIFCLFCMFLSVLNYGKITLHISINISMSMAWNVFLALIAYDFSYLAINSRRRLIQGIAGFFWLIFYPNTFYVLTDAKHFADWFDLSKLKSFSNLRTILDFNVLIFGIIFGVVLGAWSIQLILHHFVKNNYLKAVLLFVISFLSSIGIFVGRSEALRLNSWDLVFHPWETLMLIIHSISASNMGFFLTFTFCQLALIALFYLAPHLGDWNRRGE